MTDELLLAIFFGVVAIALVLVDIYTYDRRKD